MMELTFVTIGALFLVILGWFAVRAEKLRRRAEPKVRMPVTAALIGWTVVDAHVETMLAAEDIHVETTLVLGTSDFA